jgi:hypothetical protein
MPHPAKPKPTDATFPTVPATAHDVDSLAEALGEPDAKLLRLLLRNTKEDALAEWGAEVDSTNILLDMPRFVVSSLSILASLEPARRALVKLPPGIFAAIVAEAAKLATMKVGHEASITSNAGDRTDRESTQRREMREGVALRDTVIERLGNALSDDQMEQVKILAGDASSSSKLASGLTAVADYITALRKDGSEDDNDALDLWGIDAPTVQSLRAKSSTVLEAGRIVASPPRKVSQRALDIQDGRVLILVDMIWRAFRLARRTDRSILMPELSRILWMFETRSSTPKGTKEAAPPAGEDPKKVG